MSLRDELMRITPERARGIAAASMVKFEDLYNQDIDTHDAEMNGMEEKYAGLFAMVYGLADDFMEVMPEGDAVLLTMGALATVMTVIELAETAELPPI